MTSKELLIKELSRWSEDDAEFARRAVKAKHGGTGAPGVDEWGDLDAWTDAASADGMRMIDEEEAAAGFSWEEHRPS